MGVCQYQIYGRWSIQIFEPCWVTQQTCKMKAIPKIFFIDRSSNPGLISPKESKWSYFNVYRYMLLLKAFTCCPTKACLDY